MDAKTVSYENTIQNESLPSYDEAIGTSQPSTSQVERYSTYTVIKSGVFKRYYHYIQDSNQSFHNIKVCARDAKYLIDEETAYMKLKHGPFELTSTNWSIEYYAKNPEIYNTISMKKKAFQLKSIYCITMAKYDDQVDFYEIRPTNVFGTDWKLIKKENPDQILVKYTHFLFKKDKVEALESVHEEDLKLFLLFMSYVVEDEQRNRNVQSSGGAP